MTEIQINDEVLTAYLKGEIDATTAVAVEAWYDASAENRKLLGQLYYILFVNDRINVATEINVEQSLKQLKARMHPRRSIRFGRIAWRVAAAVMIAAFVTGFVATVSLSERLSKPLMVFTQLGERSQVVLPDGTKVWLNSCSQVEYSSSLFARERRVTMNGEAYFEVTPDEHAPFVVSTNGLDVRVLGTKFNIRNDDDKHQITTVLLEGSVLAYASGYEESTSIRLRPSQELIFDTETKNMQLRNCEVAERSINWIEGRFRFEQNTFEQIVAELKRYYNVDVRFMDEQLKQERFSGDFKVEDGIYHIMSVLQLTYKFHYKVDCNDIILYAN